jgi:hypothetical protein
MHIKHFTLYSLPYFVGVASLVVAAHNVVPIALRFQDTSAENAITSDQVVNRSLKSDRLPIKQAAPQANDKGKGNVKLPARIAPNPEIKVGCEQPINLNGRCFADAGERARLRAA